MKRPSLNIPSVDVDYHVFLVNIDIVGVTVMELAGVEIHWGKKFNHCSCSLKFAKISKIGLCLERELLEKIRCNLFM